MFGALFASTGDLHLLDLDDMCHIFGLTPEAIYNRRHRGDFPPAIKVGASLRWRVEDIQAWLDQRREDS